ncbi:MAG: RNA polymerase sigma factor [Saprospiraceae bacterium]|nr:RNA polymerase sigma factor [Saprospiraceae bacterium]
MYNICRRMIINDEEAQDVLQNSFIDIFTKLKMFKFESTPGAWIKRIVVNNCINHLRSRKLIIKELNFDYEIADCHDDDIELNVTVIYNAIGLLPEGYRVVFNLYAVEGYDHGEISEILNISESTSKSQYSRAKSKLYDILRTSGNLNNIYS